MIVGDRDLADLFSSSVQPPSISYNQVFVWSFNRGNANDLLMKAVPLKNLRLTIERENCSFHIFVALSCSYAVHEPFWYSFKTGPFARTCHCADVKVGLGESSRCEKVSSNNNLAEKALFHHCPFTDKDESTPSPTMCINSL